MGKFDPDEYRHESNAVSLLNYHFVFIPKRRKKVLVGVVAEKLQEIICEVCNENRWRIVAKGDYARSCASVFKRQTY